MTLPLPVLDTRTFAQLTAEGTSQIARLAPAWTNYNLSDPGITLLDLFAWLSEQNIYRADRVSDEMIRAFLRMVDIAPRSAAVAQCVLLLRAAAAPLALPNQVQISNASGTVTFETTEPLTISPASLVSVLAGGSTLTDVTAANARSYDPASDPTAGSFAAFGDTPQIGDALYLGFDAPLGTAGAPVSLYAWTTTPQQDATTRAALIACWHARREAAERDCPAELLTCLPDWRHHYAARVAWEFYGADKAWHALPDLHDETRALTLSGFVLFAAPANHAAGGPGPQFFIRCRIASGSFDAPVRLDRVGLNAVPAAHAASIPSAETIGKSKGHAGEIYATAAAPVVAGSTRLALSQGAQQNTSWQEAGQWDRVGPHDRVYVLDSLRGRLIIGNGMRGAVLPAGWQLALDYRVGGGAAGNVAANTLIKLAVNAWNATRIPGLSLTIAQPVAAFGGADAETLAAAEARAIAALTMPTRAVTLSDIATLACAIPGVPVARAAAFPNMHPAVPCFTATGSITVVVVPNAPGPAPLPSPAMLRTVAAALDPRRPVTTELHVVAPTYVTIAVTATLQADTAVNAARVSALAQQALDARFNPLTGGPNGTGWPIGRGVYRTEIMATLAELPGVQTVTALSMQADSDAPVCGNITLCATNLVRSGQHSITTTVSGTATFSRSKQRECV